MDFLIIALIATHIILCEFREYEKRRTCGVLFIRDVIKKAIK